MKANVEKRYTQKYYDDLNGIVNYISDVKKNPSAALSLLDKIEKAINKRTPIADSFESIDSAKDREQAYYKITVGNYYIFYVILNEENKDIVEYRRVLYNKRNWEIII